MSLPLQEGIARVRRPGTNEVVGTAFLIGPRHVMTCAHVVNDALGNAWDAQQQPDRPVQVDFPFASGLPGVEATVVAWHPPGPGPATDIAVLEVAVVRPRPYQLANTAGAEGRSFWTKGFPVGQDSGMDANGTLGKPIEFGRLLARGDNLPGFFIEGGFSGAPLIDERTAQVLGMAAEATRDQTKRIGFVVPADQLELAWPPLARPYKGLAAFQEADARFFQGRLGYLDELAGKLSRLPLVAVVGRSGSGKSSLVRAGLIPRLRQEAGWRVVTFRPGSPSSDPFRNLAMALQEEFFPGDDIIGQSEQLASRLRQEPAELQAWLRRVFGWPALADPPPILLVADQFEELFTSVADPDLSDPEQSLRTRFVRCLRAAVSEENGPPVARCVLTIRADYMGWALEVAELAEALKDADVKLGPMQPDEIRQAIEEPARALGVSFEDGLVGELVRAVGAHPDALPLLEFTLAEIWKRQEKRRLTRLPADQDAGDLTIDMLTAALKRHAEQVYKNLSRLFDEETVRDVFLMLIWAADPKTGGADTKRVRERAEFSDAQWALIEQLASQDRQARLVTTGISEVDGTATAEIIHEALIRGWDRLRAWLDEDRTFRVWLQKMQEQAADWRQDASAPLLTGKRLIEGERWFVEQWREPPSDTETKAVYDFVRESIAADSKRKIDTQTSAISELDKKLKKEVSPHETLMIGAFALFGLAAYVYVSTQAGPWLGQFFGASSLVAYWYELLMRYLPQFAAGVAALCAFGLAATALYLTLSPAAKRKRQENAEALRLQRDEAEKALAVEQERAALASMPDAEAASPGA